MLSKLLHYVKLVWKKGLVHILAGSFMTKLVAFFGSIFLVRVLSKEDYGILSYLDNIYGYVYVLAGMGLSNAILRYVILGKDQAQKYGYFRYSYRKSFIWNLILGAVAALVFILYPHPADYSRFTWLLNIFFLMLPFHYLTDNLLANERAMFANQRYAVLSLCLSATVILGKLLSGHFLGLYGVVFVQLGIYLLLSAGMFLSAKRTYFRGIEPALLEKSEKRTVDRYSLQYMVTNGLWTIFMLNDIFLLGRVCDPQVLADYKVAYTIPGCVSLISYALGVFIAPYFVRHEEDGPWIRRNFRRTYLISAAAVGGLCLVIALLAKPVVWLLYGEQYLNIVPTMQVLLLAAFFNNGMRYTTANLLAAMGQVKYNMIVSVSAMVLQIGVNLFVAPLYGGMGVALTSCGVYLFMALVLLIIFIRKYYRKA